MFVRKYYLRPPVYRQRGHPRLGQGWRKVRPPAFLHSGCLTLLIMKIDLNWNLWRLNGWQLGKFLSRECGSQYGTYKRPINNAGRAYKTFTDFAWALVCGSTDPRSAWATVRGKKILSQLKMEQGWKSSLLSFFLIHSNLWVLQTPFHGWVFCGGWGSDQTLFLLPLPCLGGLPIA